MAKAADYIFASTTKEGVVALKGKGDSVTIMILGGSIGKMPRATTHTNSVSFGLSGPGQDGMVAVSVRYYSGKNQQGLCFFFRVSWREGEESPKIDLEKEWVPSDPSKIGYFEYHYLEVEIDGLVYTTSQNNSSKRSISDASLLCRYIDSKISPEELAAAAKMPTREQELQDKVAELEKKNTGLWKSAEDLRRSHDFLEEESRRMEKRISELVVERDCQERLAASFKMELRCLSIEVDGQFWCSKAVKAALKSAQELLKNNQE